ncbi:MAG: hypothetical protein ACI8RD_003871 [Bacillariaceae sp.]
MTLRLAPILPIPLGMYNYVYGVSNIRYWDFAGGIFLGSLKPYFLDSYLGYFGKSLVDGSAAAQQAENGGAGTLQDYVLIGVLGFSVLIGVFASQLAAETWDAILKEQEEEEKKLQADSNTNNDDDDDVVTEIFGWELPQWAVGFQYGLQDGSERVDALVLQEYDAKVWNCTEEKSFFGIEISKNTLPDEKNPALDPKSPEITGKYKGFDYGGMTCDGIVLSPILFTYFLKFADPLFNDKTFQEERNNATTITATAIPAEDDNEPLLSSSSSSSAPLSKTKDSSTEGGDTSPSREFKEGTFLNQLLALKDETRRRLEEADEKINRLNDK